MSEGDIVFIGYIITVFILSFFSAIAGISYTEMMLEVIVFTLILMVGILCVIAERIKGDKDEDAKDF